MRTRSGEGWGQLPRRIALALASAKLNGSESRVVWVIVYKTIAHNKSKDKIPWSQFEDITGIDQWHLSRTINSLLKKGVIFRKDFVYKVQDDFSKWKIPPKQVVGEKLPPDQGKLPPVLGKIPPKRVDSRDLSKRTYQEKGVSPNLRKGKAGEVPKGLKDLIESIGNSPEKKKENYRLLKKNQK